MNYALIAVVGIVVCLTIGGLLAFLISSRASGKSAATIRYQAAPASTATTAPTVGPTAPVALKEEYSNPFDKNTQYSNPFSENTNPFDSLNE